MLGEPRLQGPWRQKQLSEASASSCLTWKIHPPWPLETQKVLGGMGGKERRLAYAHRGYGTGQLNPTSDTPSFRVLLGHKEGDLKEQFLLESGEGALWMVMSLVLSKSPLV